jgi:hypothetical protein
MKTTLTFPTILTLVLPLALLAQATNEAPPAPAAGSGRQAIINKLERIRLDTVSYDGLPLGEVVLHLRDQAKKLDPEKKGINFLMNPNPPASSAPVFAPMLGPDGNPLPAPPAEQVDLNSVSVRIKPPLTDVRLVDVLDAVVKVADHPMKYTVEDYGVVFSLRDSKPARKDETALPPAAGSGRQAISDKLDRIRLDTVTYDGLPLGEVVVNLRDEAKKRDPEKKGINFMINPNPPADYYAAVVAPRLGPDGSPLPAPPPEQVDVSAIAIKIKPPLADVRLVDVLDAMVKVADRPITYSIEDYGVVFSLQGPEPAHKDEVIAFAFPGGTPAQFLDAIQRQYNVDWVSVADIPKEMADVRVPRLRINQASLMALGHGNDVGADSLGAVVSLYNQLGGQKPELGRLIVQGGLTKPSVVMFVPDKALTDTQPKVKVKAFSIYGINNAERAKLEEDIDRARKEAMDSISHLRGSAGQRSLEGTVAIHKETSLLVATGPESFVEMVESIVTACQAKERARNPAVPSTLPNQPEK